MVDFLVVVFLVAHGLVHLAVWLPRPDPDAERPPPFYPDHSAVLTAVGQRETTTRRVSVVLAVVVTVAYVVAGPVLAFGGATAAVVALTVASALGLLLKALFFHPWLSLGVLLDGLVLSSALADWPVTIS